MPDQLNIALLGASGFVGAELLQFCIKHPNIKIQSLSANTFAGQDIQVNGNKGTEGDTKTCCQSVGNQPKQIC